MTQPSTAEMVDVIFTKLSLYYGRDFLSRWEGLDLALVKDDWAYELRGITKQSVMYALQNLPARAPHVGEFRQIALRAPAAPAPRLEAPRMDREVVRKHLAEARSMLKAKNK